MVLALGAVAVGCGGGADATREAAADDLATSLAAWLASAQPWTTDPSPALEVGAASGSAAETFLGVRHAAVLADGGIAVLDGLSSELRIFEADGAVRAVVGGPGEGPGDFKNPTRVRTWADTIEVMDPGNFRRSVYTAEGRLVRETPVSRAQATPLDSWDEWAVGLLPAEGPLLPDERAVVAQIVQGVPDGVASRAMVAGDGWVWIELRASGVTGPVWAAMAPGGGPVASLEVPAGVRILDIRGDRVIGVARDEDDVEYVRVYSIARPADAIAAPGLDVLRGA